MKSRHLALMAVTWIYWLNGSRNVAHFSVEKWIFFYAAGILHKYVYTVYARIKSQLDRIQGCTLLRKKNILCSKKVLKNVGKYLCTL